MKEIKCIFCNNVCTPAHNTTAAHDFTDKSIIETVECTNCLSDVMLDHNQSKFRVIIVTGEASRVYIKMDNWLIINYYFFKELKVRSLKDNSLILLIPHYLDVLNMTPKQIKEKINLFILMS